jgi:signal transduction histidine kinase
MKQILFSLTFFFSVLTFAQKVSSEKNITELTLKIEQSQKGEKIRWLDSLSNYIVYDTNFENDSIVKETVLKALELDSLRIATWQTGNLIYFQNNIKGKPKEGKKIFESFLGIAQKGKNHKAAAKFYLEGADSYFFLEDYKTAIIYYNLAEENAKKAKDKKFVGLAKLYKGGALSFLANFSEASQVLQEASKIFQETKDTFNIISAKNSLSILYSQNNFFKEAKAERDEAILLAQKIKSYGHLNSFYYNAATDEWKQGNNKERIKNLKTALDYGRKAPNPDLYEVTILAGFVIAYSQTDSISQAEFYLNEIEKASKKNTVAKNKESYLDALKNLMFAKKEYSRALLYGKEHLEIKKKGTHYEEIREGEKFLADVYEAKGNKEEAFVHFKNYTIIKDSISSLQKVKALSYYQTLYETEKRDAKILSQKSDILLLDARNKVKSQLLLFGGLGLLLVFGIIVLARSRNEANKRQKMQEGFAQDLINAQEEERTRVARELHDSVGQKLMLLTKQTKTAGNSEMELLAGSTLEELRSISRGLHPATLEKLGVTGAIKAMINEIDANSNIFFTNEIENIDDLLPKESSLHLYRILQEVLNNMVKHADAKVASITIERKKNIIEVVIKDNGKGFEFSEKANQGTSLGMKTLLERARIIKSTIEIKSKYNQGTTVQLIIPT